MVCGAEGRRRGSREGRAHHTDSLRALMAAKQTVGRWPLGDPPERVCEGLPPGEPDVRRAWRFRAYSGARRSVSSQIASR